MLLSHIVWHQVLSLTADFFHILREGKRAYDHSLSLPLFLYSHPFIVSDKAWFWVRAHFTPCSILNRFLKKFVTLFLSTSLLYNKKMKYRNNRKSLSLSSIHHSFYYCTQILSVCIIVLFAKAFTQRMKHNFY
jgi:hypothetical protein